MVNIAFTMVATVCSALRSSGSQVPHPAVRLVRHKETRWQRLSRPAQAISHEGLQGASLFRL